VNQKPNPTVSVIMPVYNGAVFLHAAINSILTQTFTDFELIIVNDGSKDNTEDIIRTFKDGRIVYIKNEVNLKLIKTLNKGLDLAKGKYVARMDADDISLPYRLEKQIEAFNSNSQIDIVNVNAFILSEDGKYYREQKSHSSLSNDSIKYLIPLQNFICHPGVMVKTELLKHYKYADDISKEHIEDFDLWNRMLQDGCYCYTIPEFQLLYRDNSLSINHTEKRRQVERMFSLSKTLLQRRFNFHIDNASLKAILDDRSPGNYRDLKRVNIELSNYLTYLKKHYHISLVGQKEMEVWRKQKVLVLAFRALISLELFERLRVILFLVPRISWFANHTLAGFLKKIIYQKRVRLS
jgi:glycosyltransferase involved in cell wall biosynthesis